MFSVTSPNAVSYQWFKVGGSTVLATTAGLTLTNVDSSQGGNYFCRVTNTCGTLDSNPATLSVATVTITRQPIPQSACDGTPVTLTVEATGAVAYQWWSFNGPIGGATTPTLTVTSQDLYHCVLTGTNGCTTITNQVLVYFQYPLQLNQPLENQVFCEGSEYNSIALDLVSYDPDATFQWRKNGVNVTTAIDTGVPWEFYFPLPTTMADAGVYDCVMTNQCGPVITNPFTVTVVPSVILTQPAVSQTVCVGGTATFTANAINYQPGNVLWLKTFGPGGNGGVLVGNQPTLTISNVTTANAGYYVGYFYNGCSSVRTEVILDVVPSLPPVTAASNAPTPGGTLNLTATPGTAGYYTYSWSGPNGFTSNQQNPTIPNVTTAQSGTYTVTMNGGSCSVQGTVKVAVQANTLVNLDNPTTSYTGGIAPINPSDPTFGTFTINTVLRNLSATETLQGPLYFKVTELGKTPAVPGDPRPYWLDSRNAGTPAAAGALQNIPGPVPPGGSVPVSFRIAVDQTGRSFFRFLVDVYGATNASPRTEAKLGSFNLSLGSPGSLGSLGSLKPGTRFFDFDSQDSPDSLDSLDSPDSSFIGGAGLQSGSEMAVDPNQSRRMAVVANNYAAGTVLVKYTEDGGASWREFPLSRTVGSVTYQAAFDPSVAYDGNGNLLVTYVATNLTDNAAALVICQKLLDRLTFSPPVALVTHASAEKTAIGRTSLGISKSQIAVAWESRANGGPARINLMMLLSRRTRVIAEGSVSHPSVTVDAGGRAYVGWNDWATSRLLTVSTQDGLEYTTPTPIAATGIGYGQAIAAQADVLTTPGLTLRADPSRNGTLYAAYAGSGSGLDVWLVKSTNGGQSWMAPRRLNDDSGNADQFGPGLAVDGNGNVAVSFYDTRLSTPNETANVYVVRSGDGGQTFGAGLRVTEVESNLSLTNPLRVRAVNFGERMGIGFSAKTDLNLVWTDNRNGNPDLFFTTEK